MLAKTHNIGEDGCDDRNEGQQRIKEFIFSLL